MRNLFSILGNISLFRHRIVRIVWVLKGVSASVPILGAQNWLEWRVNSGSIGGNPTIFLFAAAEFRYNRLLKGQLHSYFFGPSLRFVCPKIWFTSRAKVKLKPPIINLFFFPRIFIKEKNFEIRSKTGGKKDLEMMGFRADAILFRRFSWLDSEWLARRFTSSDNRTNSTRR